MKRATLASLVLASVAGSASAAPPGWKVDEAMALDLTRKAQRSSYFGGTATTQIAVEAFHAPSGGSLFVTRAEAAPTPDLRDGVATGALFVLVQNARRYGPAEIEATTQSANPATKTLEANLTWRDSKAGIRQIGRTIVAADPRHLVTITGECLLPVREDMNLASATETEQACVASLAALDPGIALDQRVALTMVGATAEPTEASAPTAPAPTLDRPQAAQPSMGDGGRTPMAPMTIAPAKRQVDRRPLYLGGGIVVLAALFWWNRRRRDLFDREDDVTPANPVPEATSGDDDADDLQAAARGDTKDES